MPFCPRCREEYEEGFEECADCGDKLVPSLDGLPPPESEEEPPSIPEESLYADSLEVAEFMRKALVQSTIPAYIDKKRASAGGREGLYRVAVPKEFVERAFHYLSTNFSCLIVEKVRGIPIFTPYSEEKSDEIRNPELFQKGLRRVVKRGEAVLPELVRIAAKGDAEARRLAVMAMVRIGGQGLFSVMEMLKKSCQGGNLPLFQALVQGIQSELPGKPVLFEDFYELFREKERPVRILAIRAAAKLGGERALPNLIRLLRDPDGVVQAEASEALSHITDIPEEDMGFDVSLPPEEKEAAVKRWESWWKARTGGGR